MRQMVLLFAALLTLGSLHTVARADTGFLSQVATCTGRLSALLELHRAINDPRLAETREIHAHMTDLLLAVMTPDTDQQGRMWRSDAKLRFRAFLQRLPDGRVESRADRMARNKALADIRTCAALIRTPREVDAWLAKGHEARVLRPEPARAFAHPMLDPALK